MNMNMIEIKMVIEKLWLKESYTKVCFMFLCNIWRIVQEAIFCSLTVLSHTVLWEEWVDVFDLGFFFFSFNFYFFIFLNPKWQVIFFLVFPKNVNWTVYEIFGGFPDGWNCKESACNEWVGNIPLEKEMATHSSILAQEIPCTEEPGRLQPVRLQRVRHDWVTNTH